MGLNTPAGDGHLWADDTGGDGPVLVLLHPGWGDSSIWLPVLAQLTRGYRVIRYDTCGYGQSPAPVAPFSQLADLTAVLDQRGVGQAVLVAHSGGAGAALGLALADPARVRGLLLLAPGVPDYPWPADDPYLAEFGKLYSAGEREQLTALGLRTWAAAGADEAAQAQVRAAVSAFYRVGDYEQPDPPVYPRLGEIQARAVVVLGDREYPMVARCGQDIAARIPGCVLTAAPGADHLLPLRVPALIAGLASDLAQSP